MQSPNRGRQHVVSPSAASNEVATSNLTTNHFLGTNQRSWMLQGQPQTRPGPIPSHHVPKHCSNPQPAEKIVPAASDLSRPVVPCLPSYQFLSVEGHTPPEHPTASTTTTNLEEPTEKPAAAPREVLQESTEQFNGQPVDFRAEPARQGEIEIVDLTASQTQQEPQTEQPRQARPTQPSRQHLETLQAVQRPGNTTSQLIAAATRMEVPYQPAQPSNHAISPLSITARPQNGSPQWSAAHYRSSSGVATSAPQTQASSTGADDPRRTEHSSPQFTAVGLLTPAASPLIHPPPTLHRKRSLEGTAQAIPRSRLRSDSPRHSPQMQNTPMPPYNDQYLPDNYVRRILQPQASSPQSPATHAASSTATKGQSYLAILEIHLTDMSKRIVVPSNADKLRIPWLRDACTNNDLFFLLLNQLTCAWTIQPDCLVQLGLDSSCESGLGIFQLLFGSNRAMSEELVAFLAGWPNSTYSLRAVPELRQWISIIGYILPQLGMLWESFRQKCLTRKLPPSAREINETFQLPTSMILPTAIFSTLERQLHPHAPSAFQAAALELFTLSQREHIAEVYRPGDGNQKASLQQSVESFANSYQQLMARHWPAAVFPPNVRPSLFMQAPPVQPRMSSAGMPIFQGQATGYADIVNGAASVSSRFAPQRQFITTTTPPQSRQIPTHAANQSQYSRSGQTPSARANTAASLALHVDGAGPIQTQFMRSQHNRIAQPVAQKSAPGRAQDGVSTSNRQYTFRSTQLPPQAMLLPHLDSIPAVLSNPAPEQEALHQFYLRQPATEVQGHKTGAPPNLYQFIESCTHSPCSFDSTEEFFSFECSISQELISRKSDVIQSDDSLRIPKRVLSDNSVLFNLRCALLESTSSVSVEEAEWAALQTYWPEHIFISLNDNFLDIRRKRQFKRDLPIDVTPFVKAGTNNVTVSLYKEKGESARRYGLAIETIAFRNKAQIAEMPVAIQAGESLRMILQEMQSQELSVADDDVQMVTDFTTLSITDPFSSKMISRPVRGKTCRHKNCFDLNMFLQSRNSDYKDALTSVYEWRCPVGTCKEDVRPCSLVLDGFLQEVVQKIAQEHKKDVRSIIVKKDGTWEAKSEGQSENRRVGRAESAGEVERSATAVVEPMEAVARRAASASTTDRQFIAGPSAIDVIELDDD
ncbi:hypothetical protein LTR51_005443 [Lithohypha guttulata]|nr:hypothetical protein LTR51_005443 [Lithohypha guttulata]